MSKLLVLEPASTHDYVAVQLDLKKLTADPLRFFSSLTDAKEFAAAENASNNGVGPLMAVVVLDRAVWDRMVGA